MLNVDGWFERNREDMNSLVRYLKSINCIDIL